jgi:hypothetical protein
VTNRQHVGNSPLFENSRASGDLPMARSATSVALSCERPSDSGWKDTIYCPPKGTLSMVSGHIALASSSQAAIFSRLSRGSLVYLMLEPRPRKSCAAENGPEAGCRAAICSDRRVAPFLIVLEYRLKCRLRALASLQRRCDAGAEVCVPCLVPSRDKGFDRRVASRLSSDPDSRLLNSDCRDVFDQRSAILESSVQRIAGDKCPDECITAWLLRRVSISILGLRP